jgi:hypothetical protein
LSHQASSSPSTSASTSSSTDRPSPESGRAAPFQVCGPAAFVVLKALAFGDRAEPKDAYDLIYVIRHTRGGGTAIAERLRLHAVLHTEIVAHALGLLNRDFNTPDDIGPRRAAAFTITADTELDDAAADSHGFVDDLLRATARLGLRKIDV